MKRKNILQCLAHDKKAIEEYGVKSLSVFGSVARGDEKETSDIDILVSFNQPLGFFAFMKLRDHLEGILPMLIS
jgi:uncharacterized protein